MTLALYHFPSVECRLLAPLTGEDGTVVGGFAVSYYVVATSRDEALSLVQSDCTASGGELADFEPPRLIERLAAPIHVLMRSIWTARPHVIWRSGRAFFPLDQGEH